MNLLLIEDNTTIAKSLSYSLEQEGFHVICKDHLKDAFECLKTTTISFIILDIMLPDGNGLEFYEQKIKKTKIPTIILTAKDEEEDIVKGLELGAEDYITKPFFVKELITRIHKILRQKKTNTIITIKEIEFDLDKMEVYKKKQKINLTSLELKILHLLFVNRNKVVTRAYIIDKIWDWTGNDVNDNTITVYLKRIREKLNTDMIKTIKGIGYRIDCK